MKRLMENWRQRILRVMVILCLIWQAVPLLGFAADTTLEFWMNAWPIHSSDAILEVVKLYEDQHPGVKVNVTKVAEKSLYEKLLVAYAAGVQPDVVTLKGPIGDLINAGVLTTFDSILKPGATLRLTDYDPMVWAAFAKQGSIYGVPALSVGVNDALISSVAALQNNGFDPNAPPRTLDELKTLHRKLTRVNGDKVEQFGFDPFGGMGPTMLFDHWSLVYGVKWYDANNKLALTSPKIIQALEFALSFYDLAAKPQVEAFQKANASGYQGALGKGLQGMMMSGSWIPGQAKSSNVDPGIFTYNWFPTENGRRVALMESWGLVMPRGSSHQKEALSLIDTLVGPTATQIIFDRTGWVNGNLRSIKQLDLRTLPASRHFILAFTQADETRSLEHFPLRNDVTAAVNNAVLSIARNGGSVRTVLESLQPELQAKIDAALAKK